MGIAVGVVIFTGLAAAGVVVVRRRRLTINQEMQQYNVNQVRKLRNL